jgi:Na+/melibiose symporter-like transporter
MRIAGTVVGIILILLGGLWILQGSNVIGGSVMSGQSQWLYIGIVVLIVGAIALWWTYRRRA